MPPTPFRLHLYPSTCDLIDTLGSVISIPIGPASLSNQHFRSPIPTELELEYAIMLIEDYVMPLDKKLPPHRSVLSVSNNIPDLNLDDLLIQHRSLNLDEFEAIFNRALAEKSSRYSMAALLIIRECLHHLRFTQLDYDEAL